ncbi:MAG: hypothetical protein HZA61_11660 [Candidatus Eisenbacteria bacterium]|uniref:Outer membrane protein beta-barrel domain-containing protein n=1 Tax=Eiseniibacteriota bacterium TaxID=2212470 RepID=A0A933SGX4_UNCEI|nr:hypothetical protein [Candidatus Eisenbacteria bacterium]
MPRRLTAPAFVLAALSLVAGPALAADPATHALPSPAWAVEFGIANASLTSFDGATISLRRQKSPHAAWRYGLSVSASTSKNDQERTASQSTQTSNDVLNTSSSNLALSVTRLTFPAPDAVVRPWFGAGLELGWSASKYERSTVYRDQNGGFDGSQGYEDRNHGPSAALMGLFGLEWNASDRFAIHAQYGQAVRYRRLFYEYDEHQVYTGGSSDYHREGPMSEWSTYGVSARAGVSVFW